ncbi:MAG: hypothetical protein WCT21_04135 [Patescibacteria group bacterium]|jgi:hypothetical protein
MPTDETSDADHPSCHYNDYEADAPVAGNGNPRPPERCDTVVTRRADGTFVSETSILNDGKTFWR